MTQIEAILHPLIEKWMHEYPDNCIADLTNIIPALNAAVAETQAEALIVAAAMCVKLGTMSVKLADVFINCADAILALTPTIVALEAELRVKQAQNEECRKALCRDERQVVEACEVYSREISDLERRIAAERKKERSK